MTVRLSFIIATTGRPTLHRMVQSIVDQLEPGDEIILATNAIDGLKVDDIERPFRLKFGHQIRHAWLNEPGQNWGHAERNYVIDGHMATGTHLVFGDDDDAFAPTACRDIKDEIMLSPHDTPIMFKMIDAYGALIWTDMMVRQGNHGTPQFVVPNQPERLGRFGNRYEGDFDFVRSTLAKRSEPHKYAPVVKLVWSPKVIYGCRDFGNFLSVQEV